MQFTGCPTFLTYTLLIFEKSGASFMDAYVASNILAAAQLVGGICSTQIADKLGRKLSMIISFLGSAIALLILTIYLYLNQFGYDLTTSYPWTAVIPVASIAFTMFISSAGVLALFAVCFVEYLPTKVSQKQ